MKKLVIGLVTCSLIAMISFNNIYAKTETPPSNDSNSCGLVSDDESDSLSDKNIVNKQYDSEGNLESFDVIVPLAEGELPEPETRGIISVIVTIYKTCKVASTMGAGFNPCTYLALALGRAIVNGTPKWNPSDYGDWKVVRTSHFGYKPGCEPRHSQGCNGWYYTYSYAKIK